MFIVLLNYKKSIEIIDNYIVAHRAFLDDGYEKNYFVASGPKNPRTGGVIISQLKDKSKLQEILNQDPFFTHDIANYEIIEFFPIKNHPNFSYFIE